jgi:hypothetical protein
MKTLLCTIILATLGAITASAGEVTITFDQPDQVGAQGSTLQFFGTIVNNTGSLIFLNGDDLNLSGLSLTPIDLFFSNVPLTLDANASSGDIELFDVTVNNPLLDPTGTYKGAYDLTGGAADDAQDVLDTEAFSVTTVPEPGSFALMLAATLLLAGAAKLKVRANT